MYDGWYWVKLEGDWRPYKWDSMYGWRSEAPGLEWVVHLGARDAIGPRIDYPYNNPHMTSFMDLMNSEKYDEAKVYWITYIGKKGSAQGGWSYD
jgi:hypothetical protein